MRVGRDAKQLSDGRLPEGELLAEKQDSAEHRCGDRFGS